MSSGNSPAASFPEKTSWRTLLSPSTVIRLLISWGVVLLFLLFGPAWLAEPVSSLAAISCFVVLFSTILYAAFGVVHEADCLADALGEPYGTLILTIAIVGIEVILIAAVMLGPGESATIARDSIFAVMMIILNLITGLCLLLGGLRYGEQEYNSLCALTIKTANDGRGGHYRPRQTGYDDAHRAPQAARPNAGSPVPQPCEGEQSC